MTNETIGMIISLVAMTAIILSFQMRNKVTLLVVQTIGSSLFMISYIFAGGGIGAVLNAIALVRNFVFMKLDGKKGKKVTAAVIAFCLANALGFLLYIFAIAPTISLEDKIWSLAPVIGMSIGTVAFSMIRLNLVRIIKLGDSVCWLSYNSHIGRGALGGILCEIFSIASIGIALLRFKSKPDEEGKTEEASSDKE